MLRLLFRFDGLLVVVSLIVLKNPIFKQVDCRVLVGAPRNGALDSVPGCA